MYISRKDPNSDYRYKLIGNTLEQVEQKKDVGVIIDDQLNFDKRIRQKVKKAASISALIRRMFHHLDEESFIPLYKTLVRTHLDYASSVWHPLQDTTNRDYRTSKASNKANIRTARTII
jgi:hypothetical protein